MDDQRRLAYRSTMNTPYIDNETNIEKSNTYNLYKLKGRWIWLVDLLLALPCSKYNGHERKGLTCSVSDFPL